MKGHNKPPFSGPDENGFYTMVLGELNTAFDNKHVSVPSLISAVNKRLSGDRHLYGELGNPKVEHGQHINRLMEIDERKVAVVIKDVRVMVAENKDMALDKYCQAIVTGSVKPAGPFASSLDFSKDVNFGMRAMVNTTEDGDGKTIHDIMSVVTWDLVSESV